MEIRDGGESNCDSAEENRVWMFLASTGKGVILRDVADSNDPGHEEDEKANEHGLGLDADGESHKDQHESHVIALVIEEIGADSIVPFGEISEAWEGVTRLIQNKFIDGSKGSELQILIPFVILMLRNCGDATICIWSSCHHSSIRRVGKDSGI